MMLHKLQSEWCNTLRYYQQQQNLSAVKKGWPQSHFQNVHNSLLGVMEVSFPLCEVLLGRALFLSIAQDFIKMHPPEMASLSYYGAYFPHFLKTYMQPLPHKAWLVKLATYEWLWHRAFYAADEAIIGADALLALSETDLAERRLCIHASIGVFKAHSQFIDVLAALQRVHLTANPYPDVLPDTKSETYYVVKRPHLTVEVAKLSQISYKIYKYAKRNYSIKNIFERLMAEKYSETEVMSGLSEIFALQLFAKIV